MLRPILNNTKKGDVVCDPFLGSGTTMIAAEQSDRICYGMEIDPQYCDIIIARWEKFTSEKASKIN
jgi:DNA modification methylase